MFRLAFVLAVAAAVVLALGVSAVGAQSSDGIIDGVVLNGTQDAVDNSTADLEVTLITYEQGELFDWVTTRANGDGSFHFEGLETGPQYSHQCSVEYRDVQYASDLLTFAEDETAVSANITVYETTTDDEAIVILNTHMAIYTDHNPFRVVEQYTFFNEGDTTYVGPSDSTAGGTPTLLFSVPGAAADLQPQLGLVQGYTVSTAGGFADTTPVIPGSRVVSFSYYLSGDSGTLDFSKTINYQTYAQSVVVLGGQIDVRSDQLPQQDILVIPDSEGNDRQWTLLSGNHLARGTDLRVTVSGLSESSNTLTWVIGALAMAALGFVLVYFLIRRRRRPAPAAAPTHRNDTQRKTDGLLRQLAELDDGFEDGTISKEAYERMRSEKKAELVRLMQQSKDIANAANNRA